MHHANYPHEPGRLPDCDACMLTCNCNQEAVEQGRETECVWVGHDASRDDIAVLPDEKLAELQETAAGLEHDAYHAMEAIEKVRWDRTLRGIKKATEDNG